MVHRLSWEGTEAADADRRRALPAGDYRLISYRILMQEGEDAWHVSATGPSIRKVSIGPGEDLRIEVDPRIQIASRFHNSRISIAVRGENKAGLSIYKNGSRIPIGFRLVTEDGDELASGDLEYG